MEARMSFHNRLVAAVLAVFALAWPVFADEAALDKLRRSLDPDRPLSRGFARVQHADGRLAASAGGLRSGEAVVLTFARRAKRYAALSDVENS